ncbi:MAG: hypothetical protein OXT67_10305, partial [Zetaproteobacteria bacterium]|nr:hypothetical protein [Zetaproteobacteria bacterium]
NQPKQQDLESADIIERTRNFISRYSMSQFPLLETVAAGNFQGKMSGFRKVNAAGEAEFYVMIDTFREEICKGVSWRKGLTLLHQLGFLQRSTKGYSKEVSCKGMARLRAYHIDARILATVDSVA